MSIEWTWVVRVFPEIWQAPWGAILVIRHYALACPGSSKGSPPQRSCLRHTAALLAAEGQWLYFECLSEVWAPYSLSKLNSTTLPQICFSCLCLSNQHFCYGPLLMTISESWIASPPWTSIASTSLQLLPWPWSFISHAIFWALHPF